MSIAVIQLQKLTWVGEGFTSFFSSKSLMEVTEETKAGWERGIST